jgi:hypothetical protein
VRFADIGGIVDHHYISSFCICYKRDAQLSQINTSECFSQTVTELPAEQELPTLPVHLSSPAVFSGVCVTRSFVLYVCFVDRCSSFCTFSFDHRVVCSSSIYGL